jgi:hypothetical protein
MVVAVGRRLHDEGNGPQVESISDESLIAIQASGLVTFFWLCVEITVSVIGQKVDYIIGPDWKWNAFDVAVFFVTIIEMIGSASGESFLNLSVFRVLRLARIIRCVRMFRVLKFLGRVRSMLIAMGGSIVSLGWAIMLMSMIMFSVSIVLLQGLANHLEDDSRDYSSRRLQWAGPSSSLDDGVFYWSVQYTRMQQMQTLYGSLPRSILTCFRAVIGDVDFFTAIYVLAEVDWGYAVVFVAFTVVMILGVLNVLTGIFCDAAMQAAQQDRDNMIQEKMQEKESLVKSLTSLFSQGDADHSGFVTKAEFNKMMNNPKVEATLDTMGITLSEATGLFALLDSGGDGTVDVHEFVSGCVRLKGDAKAVDMVTLIFENKKVLTKIEKLSRLIHALKNGETMPAVGKGSAVL